MRARGIFLIRDGTPVVLSQQPYRNEDLFQALLAEFPEVLAGGTTAPDGDVQRLILVTREMGIPSIEGGSATFSLDHLFIDETGVPIFVEVKRSSDTRIRREVVGQMLDYAANGVAYWPPGTLRSTLEERSATENDTGDQAIRETFGDIDQDHFWDTVEQNLREGNVRLVFVADRLPPELVRIIEFLNERMSPTEVLGVEVSQYVGEGHELFVPELVGKTARAVTTKRRSPGPLWEEDTFLGAARDRHGSGTEAFFRSLFNHVRQRHGRFSWGRGVSPGVSGWYPINGEQLALWTANAGVYTDADGAPSGAPSMFIYPSEVRDRVDGSQFERFIDELDLIDAYKQKLGEPRSVGWKKKYPILTLTHIVASPVDQGHLFAAFDSVADAPLGGASIP